MLTNTYNNELMYIIFLSCYLTMLTNAYTIVIFGVAIIIAIIIIIIVNVIVRLCPSGEPDAQYIIIIRAKYKNYIFVHYILLCLLNLFWGRADKLSVKKSDNLKDNPLIKISIS